MEEKGSYHPFVPARHPGGKPSRKPRYRVLVHRKLKELWESLPQRVGLESVQQFYDHVANDPGSTPPVGSTSILLGPLGRPWEEGFSRTYHYEISGAGRINYQFNDTYRKGMRRDPHRVVFILYINLGSH